MGEEKGLFGPERMRNRRHFQEGKVKRESESAKPHEESARKMGLSSELKTTMREPEKPVKAIAQPMGAVILSQEDKKKFQKPEEVDAQKQERSE